MVTVVELAPTTEGETVRATLSPADTYGTELDDAVEAGVTFAPLGAVRATYAPLVAVA